MQADSEGRAAVVFIVDDDDGVRGSLEMLVRSVGFRSRAFSSGQEFLDAYDGEDGCVLLDVRMPGMNGFEVAPTPQRHGGVHSGDLPHGAGRRGNSAAHE